MTQQVPKKISDSTTQEISMQQKSSSLNKIQNRNCKRKRIKGKYKERLFKLKRILTN